MSDWEFLIPPFGIILRCLLIPQGTKYWLCIEAESNSREEATVGPRAPCMEHRCLKKLPSSHQWLFLSFSDHLQLPHGRSFTASAMSHVPIWNVFSPLRLSESPLLSPCHLSYPTKPAVSAPACNGTPLLCLFHAQFVQLLSTCLASLLAIFFFTTVQYLTCTESYSKEKRAQQLFLDE